MVESSDSDLDVSFSPFLLLVNGFTARTFCTPEHTVNAHRTERERKRMKREGAARCNCSTDQVHDVVPRLPTSDGDSVAITPR